MSPVPLPLPVEQGGSLFPMVQLIVVPISLDHQVIVRRTAVLKGFLDTQKTLPKQERYLCSGWSLKFQNCLLSQFNLPVLTNKC